jgi:hypothetical protein
MKTLCRVPKSVYLNVGWLRGQEGLTSARMRRVRTDELQDRNRFLRFLACRQACLTHSVSPAEGSLAREASLLLYPAFKVTLTGQ